ncbi:hypothetical protein, partial [Cecembia lonarensis]|uniref:hypothetical protein n=1 Tax=Cecembia lonarensis TaxID=645110 RepID=UPI0012FB6132
MEYLLMIRKQIKPTLSKKAFLIHLKNAFKKIEKIWQREFKSILPPNEEINEEMAYSFGLPFSAFRSIIDFEKLSHFDFSKMYKKDLEGIGNLIDS